MKWLLAACVLMIAFASPLAAQPAGSSTIVGRVVDPQGSGVVGRVQVVQASTGLRRETLSDAAGRFALPGIQPAISR